jgi:malonyl-CoA/methylmalonyl-CoA synthetase
MQEISNRNQGKPMANPLYDALLKPHQGRDAPFIINADGHVITHADFIKMAGKLANALKAAGLKPDDRLAVQVEKSPQALALYAAAVQAGVVFLPLNPAYTTEELQYFIEDSGARLMVCSARAEASLKATAERLKVKILTLDSDGVSDGRGSLMALAESLPAESSITPRKPDDLAALLYTSGTTGRSKGAMLSHKNLLSNAETLTQAWRFTSQDRLIHALPIFHTHGLFVASNVALLAGCSMVFMPKFDLDAVIDALASATAMMGVPTFYTRLLDDPRLDRDLTAGMRLFISGSAPLLAETHVQFERRTGHRILERYGMTETSMITSNPYDGERRAGTVGFPLDGVEIRISDAESGDRVADGEIGIIEVRGANVFSGYWNMPEKTKAEFRTDGFFITGDMGQIDQDGYVSIVGRNKDLIISGGFNIYPKEVEVILDAQDGIKESAVIGVPHADFGESVVGVLTVEEGKTADLDAIMAALRDNLAGFKHPRKLIVIDELPRNSMGKVQKNTLREKFKFTLEE